MTILREYIEQQKTLYPRPEGQGFTAPGPTDKTLLCIRKAVTADYTLCTLLCWKRGRL